jgi:hypothetical protein
VELFVKIGSFLKEKSTRVNLAMQIKRLKRAKISAEVCTSPNYDPFEALRLAPNPLDEVSSLRGCLKWPSTQGLVLSIEEQR